MVGPLTHLVVEVVDVDVAFYLGELEIVVGEVLFVQQGEAGQAVATDLEAAQELAALERCHGREQVVVTGQHAQVLAGGYALERHQQVATEIEGHDVPDGPVDVGAGFGKVQKTEPVEGDVLAVDNDLAILAGGGRHAGVVRL